jgi:hypothetical protein
VLDCNGCAQETPHTRRLSRPARYMYDRPYKPFCKGGKFDTEGYRRLPKLPELPDDACFDQARDFLTSKQWKDRRKERHEAIQINAAKRARAAAMKKHPTMDIRNTPLPGDPPE